MTRSWLGSILFASAALVVGASACEDSRPGRPLPPGLIGGGNGGTGGTAPMDTCTAPPIGECGHEVNEIEFNTPNIYFIFDKSGSMADLAGPDFNNSRYTLVHRAAVDMVRSLGALINVGAAVFPNGQQCAAGREVMEITPGDPTPSDGGDGPTTTLFRQRTGASPRGGTPISATLEILQPILAEVEGDTVVMLLTDGGPNCNGDITCDADECQPIIEGDCPVGEDCCSASHPTGGPQLCIDATATIEGVAAIHELGMEVYVIGIPGSEAYVSVLDQMAVAGGTAREDAPTQYHRVDEVAGIGDVFASIAADAISCELPLAERPSLQDEMFANVYLDCDLIPFDPVNGWGWLEGNKIWLHGEACQKLKSGQVDSVHIAFGCPTEIPK